MNVVESRHFSLPTCNSDMETAKNAGGDTQASVDDGVKTLLLDIPPQLDLNVFYYFLGSVRTAG